jgi:alkanesulfonate monooxygenase SsuD/methylene tetrahydromethanopterin reductase-like flavin-dependent oxidoreductase (luciferase family)
MRIGLFSNGERSNQIAKTTYDEDLAEVVLADELGVQEAWISEHGTFIRYQAPDQLPCAELFICKAAVLTKQIRMGPGIRPLPYFHPLQVATDAAVCDHLTNGRYMAGFGVGLGSKTPQRGPLPDDTRAMTQEAIDLILTAWTAPEPFDWHGQFWQGEKLLIIPQPLTKPHMEVGMACSRSEGTLELTAQKGFIPLMSWVPLPKQLKEMIEIYQRAGAEAHRPAPLSRVRVARMVYVTNSVEQAKHDLRDVDLGAAKVTGRLNHYIPAGGTGDDLTMEYMIDQGAFFCGDPDTVYHGIKDLYAEIGGFGVLLLLAGKDWGTREQRERSMRLFMSDVAPRLANLDPDSAAAEH